MNLRLAFHVSPPAAKEAPKPEPVRMTMIDVDVDYEDEPLPRGRSYETWMRARGWASED